MEACPHLSQGQFADLNFNDRNAQLWDYTQRGLVYPSPFAIFALAKAKSLDSIALADLTKLMATLRLQIHTDEDLRQKNSSVVLGVGISLWKKLSEDNNMPLPKGMELNFPTPDGDSSTVFERSSNAFQDSGADLWFHIKSDDENACHKMLELIGVQLGSQADLIDSELGNSRTQGGQHSGKVLGCRFSENLNNPTDPVTIGKHAVVTSEDIEHLGASYVLAQRFQINWEQLHMMSEDQIEDIIGRKVGDTIIPTRDTRSHIKSARMQDENGNTTPVLRLGLPFGQSPYLNDPELAPKGSNLGDEQGIFFAGYARSLGIMENIMHNQIGDTANFMNDRLLNNVKSDLGGFFYIPSRKDLKLDEVPEYSHSWGGKTVQDWSKFPGVDWSRLDRHFTDQSDSEYMFYNHKNYLYRMATMSDEDAQRFHRPTNRILSLLENAFSRWQDNWYVDRKQMDMGALTDYMADYDGSDKPADVMQESIMIRKGWATRMQLHLYTSEDYGFRGQKLKLADGSLIPFCGHYRPENSEVINGADTFRIEPEEIIVGGMPNLSLGQGRYVMSYLTDEERQDGFSATLSEASGVGHVIPAFDKLLDNGLDALISQTEQQLAEHTDPSAKELCQAAILTLRGVSEFNQRYSDLADSMINQMTDDGQAWERQNLTLIRDRMAKLAHSKPDTMTEALQLIYTLHCSLHMNGEPTSLGRIDQLINSYYEADIAAGRLTAESAQEVLDAFFIKLDEKVQPNRLHVEDHQPFGNLAMGGSSGPYPQGGGINQWVQQLTVGGAILDGNNQIVSAYNDVTKLCLRASARLPLNAPCLSLRVRQDIPEDVVEEAAKAIMSGGAHPILLNDDQFIEGIRASGDGVGGDNIAEATDNKWNSTVSLASAVNYACDGCYEPQFPGENWFSLGGLNTLEPLECALNRGRKYASAGMGYLRGQVASFTSKDPAQIESFEELTALFLKHFDWMNRRGAAGQLGNFGNNTSYCPAPLLSVFVDDCLKSGLDYYAGGAKYNIYGPCYTALSSTINSLYAIKVMVFDQETAVTSLPELVNCLSCDWGNKMVEPFISQLAGEARIAARADRFKRLREIALSQPRYGRGNAEIDAFGNELIKEITTLSVNAYTQPRKDMLQRMTELANEAGSEAYPFGIQIQPGVGTFENHVEMGQGLGASADGRRLNETIASDLSPTPSPADKPVKHQVAEFSKALAGFASEGVEAMTNGAPTDFNITEDFPLESVKQVINQFAQGSSANILTITTASPDSFDRAMGDPERFDLLRVRTGGWSEFFTAMFPDKQEQHQRRPLSTPATEA
ncbi:MAG: Dyp-type peroxidase [Marinobacterium sp.]|nr:Dyp-type peroxidase [Marinobacterium sp.]